MKSLRSLFVLSLMHVLSAPFTLASDSHEGHNHEASVEDAPRGGTMRDTTPEKAGETRYKAELLLDGDQALIHLYDFPAPGKPGQVGKVALVPAKITATEMRGKFKPARVKKEQEVVFKRDGNVFKGTLKGASKVHRYDFHLYLIENGKKNTLDFGVDNIH